jgi:hypothetical protein
MSMTLEIPRPSDEELTWDAEREGVSASDLRGKYASVGVSSADLRRDREADDAISERQMRGPRP